MICKKLKKNKNKQEFLSTNLKTKSMLLRKIIK
jgi:hypothetical protein